MKRAVKVLEEQLKKMKNGEGIDLHPIENEQFENILWLSSEINKEYAKIETRTVIVPQEY